MVLSVFLKCIWLILSENMSQLLKMNVQIKSSHQIRPLMWDFFSRLSFSRLNWKSPLLFFEIPVLYIFQIKIHSRLPFSRFPYSRLQTTLPKTVPTLIFSTLITYPPCVVQKVVDQHDEAVERRIVIFFQGYDIFRPLICYGAP